MVDSRENERLASNRIFHNIIRSMSEGVMLIDQQGEILLSNPALNQILGIDQGELEQGLWKELLFIQEANSQFGDLVLGVIQERICFMNRSVPFTTPQGDRRHLIVNATLVDEELGHANGPPGILLMVNDVTETVGLMESSRRLYREKAESLDRLARAVAHEIRNPTTAIGGLARRLMTNMQSDRNHAQYLEGILDGSKRLEAVVREVRNYADLPTPQPEPVDVIPWLLQLVRGYQQRLAWQGVRLRWMVPQGDHAALDAEFDPSLVARSIKVLIDNALDAMPGGGQLTLELNGEDGQISIRVIDTGHGLSSRDMPYVFDPFYTTKADRVGMNLAMAQAIAREHGGELSAKNRDTGGAAFTLRLPRESTLLLMTHPQPAPPPSQLKQG